MDKSIKLIRWSHDGEVLTGEVGQEITGIRTAKIKRHGQRVEVPRHRRYSTTVTRIVDTRPWEIYHTPSSEWNNPIYTNEVLEIHWSDGSQEHAGLEYL